MAIALVLGCSGSRDQAAHLPLGAVSAPVSEPTTTTSPPPPVTEAPPVTDAPMTVPTTTVPATAAPAAPTTRARATTTNPPFGADLAPITPAGPLPTSIVLTLGANNYPCPDAHPGGRVDWFIGDATPGTGKLSYDNGLPNSVPDSGFVHWCADPPARTFTYTATGPRGPATRTITL